MNRYIGQEIFKTIVEMSYEMAHWERAEKEWIACNEVLDEFYDRIQSKRSTRVLRSMEQRYSSKKDEELYSRPFKCCGELLKHNVILEYERYTDQEDKIRERIFFTLSVYPKKRFIFAMGRSHHEDTFNQEKEGVKEDYKENLSLLWKPRRRITRRSLIKH